MLHFALTLSLAAWQIFIAVRAWRIARPERLRYWRIMALAFAVQGARRVSGAALILRSGSAQDLTQSLDQLLIPALVTILLSEAVREARLEHGESREAG